MSPVRDVPEAEWIAKGEAPAALSELVRLLARQAVRDALCDEVDCDSPDAEPTSKSEPR